MQIQSFDFTDTPPGRASPMESIYIQETIDENPKAYNSGDAHLSFSERETTHRTPSADTNSESSENGVSKSPPTIHTEALPYNYTLNSGGGCWSGPNYPHLS